MNKPNDLGPPTARTHLERVRDRRLKQKGFRWAPALQAWIAVDPSGNALFSISAKELTSESAILQFLPDNYKVTLRGGPRDGDTVKIADMRTSLFVFGNPALSYVRAWEKTILPTRGHEYLRTTPWEAVFREDKKQGTAGE